jgi:signal transduction histidine kinase
MSILANGAHDRRHFQLLLRWRWLVLIVAIPISLVIELLEGASHDLQLLDEVLIDGLVLPTSTWMVLTFAARRIERQFEREKALEQRQSFLQRLAENRGYHDLTHFVVHYPATVLPVDHTSLFVYDHVHARFELADEWNSDPNAESPVESYLHILSSCRACLVSGPSTLRHAGVCAFATGRARDASVHEYCLPLSHNNVLVGVLRLRCTPGKTPSAEQIDDLTELSSEIALALALAIADSREVERLSHEARLRERQRIAHELHDTLAQQVFYLHLGLDELADGHATVDSDAARRKIASMRDVAADVYEQIRHNLSILRTWQQVSLSDAVSDLARITAHNAEIPIDIRVEGVPTWLPPHTCEHLYGVVREGLNNILKHSHARHVLLQQIWSPQRLTIHLSDDGVGFDPDRVAVENHYGLQLMTEAIEALDGTCTIDSRPGGGTRLQVSIPLQPANRALRQQESFSPQLRTALDLSHNGG